MKRIGNIYETIYSKENLILADQRARKGKRNQPGVKLFDQKRDSNIDKLHLMLKNKTYKTSTYTTFPIFEPKERQIFRLPYFPDRIVHHAAMIPLEKIFVSTFTADTYSCIKNKGIHAASFALRKALKDVEGTKYCLKLDIKKFYPSIDHDILKSLLRRKIKDKDLLWLLDGIIDSADGVPIGNYLSQYFANFYLTYFDHWIKENMRVKYYFRYADDMVILSDNKEYLHQLLADMRQYLKEELKLEIKGNYQIFPVASRGIDFVGYPSWHTHTYIRKSIKKKFIKMLKRNKNRDSINSYKGWIKHCNGKHLLKKLLNEQI
jgi:RNA-directed DNA polymerase